MSDLFGYEPPQRSMFDIGLISPPRPPASAQEDRVRARLTGLLETARAAAAMPWEAQEARMWRTMFPNMANWLPAEEADRMRAEWAAEMARLDAVGVA